MSVSNFTRAECGPDFGGVAARGTRPGVTLAPNVCFWRLVIPVALTVFLLTGYHVYRGHNLSRRGLMDHMSRAWNAPQGTVSYITMQVGGLLRFTHSILPCLQR